MCLGLFVTNAAHLRKQVDAAYVRRERENGSVAKRDLVPDEREIFW
jgi:hypothetical protein